MFIYEYKTCRQSKDRVAISRYKDNTIKVQYEVYDSNFEDYHPYEWYSFSLSYAEVCNMVLEWNKEYTQLWNEKLELLKSIDVQTNLDYIMVKIAFIALTSH